MQPLSLGASDELKPGQEAGREKSDALPNLDVEMVWPPKTTNFIELYIRIEYILQLLLL